MFENPTGEYAQMIVTGDVELDTQDRETLELVLGCALACSLETKIAHVDVREGKIVVDLSGHRVGHNEFMEATGYVNGDWDDRDRSDVDFTYVQGEEDEG